MKQLKDYLHLYLGCKMTYSTHHEPQNEVYILTDQRLREAIEFEDKPILRHLSDMTEEEKVERGKVILSARDEGLSEMAEVVRWQLSKHFDLFGLINAGLAIDATTV